MTLLLAILKFTFKFLSETFCLTMHRMLKWRHPKMLVGHLEVIEMSKEARNVHHSGL